MAGRLAGKVAFITGAARGQGRSHAIRLAQDGADIIAVDICGQIDSVPYPLATPGDLAETAKQVEALDRRIVTAQADVRDEAALKAAFDTGSAELGPVTIVIANAGIAPMSLSEPASTGSTVPVTYRPSSDTSQAIALEMSSGSTTETGSALAMSMLSPAAAISALVESFMTIGVLTPVGCTVLTGCCAGRDCWRRSA